MCVLCMALPPGPPPRHHKPSSHGTLLSGLCGELHVQGVQSAPGQHTEVASEANFSAAAALGAAGAVRNNSGSCRGSSRESAAVEG
jgi:hypothetical protein